MGQEQSSMGPKSPTGPTPTHTRRESVRRTKESFRHRIRNKLHPAKPGVKKDSPAKSPGARRKHRRRPSTITPAPPKPRRASVKSVVTSLSGRSGTTTPTGNPFSRKRRGPEAGQAIATQIKKIIGPIDRYALEANWISALGSSDACMSLDQFKTFLRVDGLSDQFAALLYRTFKHIPALLDPRFLPGFQNATDPASHRSSAAASRRGSVDNSAGATSTTPRLRSRRPSFDAFGQAGGLIPDTADLSTYATQPLSLAEFYIAYGVYRGYLFNPGSLRSPAIDRWDTTGLIIWKALMANLAPLFVVEDEVERFMAELDGKADMATSGGGARIETEDWCVFLEGCATLLECTPQSWVRAASRDPAPTSSGSADATMSTADGTALSSGEPTSTRPTAPIPHFPNPAIRRLWQGFLRVSGSPTSPDSTDGDVATVSVSLGATFIQRFGERWFVVVGEYISRKFLELAAQPHHWARGSLADRTSGTTPGATVEEVPAPLKLTVLPQLNIYPTVGAHPRGGPVTPSHPKADIPLLDQLTLWFLTWSLPAEWVTTTGGRNPQGPTLGLGTSPAGAASRSCATSRRGSLLSDGTAPTITVTGAATPTTESPRPLPPASLPTSRRGSLTPANASQAYGAGSTAFPPSVSDTDPSHLASTLRWPRLYVGSEHGFSMTQFERHVFHYPSPTLLVVRAECPQAAKLGSVHLFSTPSASDSNDGRHHREVTLAVVVDQPWRFGRSFFGQSRCAVLACDPVFHRFPSTAEHEAHLARRRVTYDRFSTHASPLHSRRNSQAVASPALEGYFGLRSTGSAGDPTGPASSPLPQIPEKYQSVFTPPDRAQHDRDPDQKYAYCHPSVGIGLGGLGSIPAQLSMAAGQRLGVSSSSASTPRPTIGSVGQGLSSLALASDTPSYPFVFHLDNDLRRVTWLNDPFRLNSGTAAAGRSRSGTLGSGTGGSGLNLNAPLSGTSGQSRRSREHLAPLPFVPADPVQDFCLTMDVLDVEVYGMGPESALIIQQRARDVEMKEAERRLKFSAIPEHGNAQAQRQILEWAGIVTDSGEMQTYGTTAKPS
ncbi:Restriction of telomere capping protein 5 [Tieghemiomyces parasiticus]|uniref:Restriction of telomere capping protein 5 n=1 Tax=Tieghemiomyces parasiticus TaxID=78921 RepID=A0A9W8DZV5_9FUNG|nr:Restriction of telomere capping protein 5 [Tieghemiomyces parasiticus]